MKAAERREKGIALGVEPREFDGPLDGIGAVVDEKTAAEPSRSDSGEQPRKSSTPRLEQFLAVERHATHLILDRLDDARMIDARTEDAIAAEAIDVLPSEQILQHGSLPGPFECRKLTRFRDRFAIGDESPIEMLLIRIDGLGDEVLLLVEGHRLPADQIEISAAEL